jgi:hypothetical protein
MVRVVEEFYKRWKRVGMVEGVVSGRLSGMNFLDFAIGARQTFTIGENSPK